MGNDQSQQEVAESKVFGDDVQKIRSHFLLKDKDVFQLLEIFVESDTKSKGYLTMDGFIDFVNQDEVNLILPCTVYLFRLIAKQQGDRLFFQEWLGSMVSFCLYNKDSLFKFIFDMIDTDEDGIITQEDISQYLDCEDPKSKAKIFPTSFILSFSQSGIQMGKEIHFEDFRKINETLKFLCWPAQTLQEILRNKLLGVNFWEALSLMIQQKESELKNMSNKDRLAQENKRIKEQKFRKLFQSRSETETRFKKRMHLRQPGEISSETKLTYLHCHNDSFMVPKGKGRKSLFDR